MTDFDNPWGMQEAWLRSVNNNRAPEPPAGVIEGCAWCGRAWTSMPADERADWRCWSCRHWLMDPARRTGDGCCTEPTCPIHGERTP